MTFQVRWFLAFCAFFFVQSCTQHATQPDRMASPSPVAGISPAPSPLTPAPWVTNLPFPRVAQSFTIFYGYPSEKKLPWGDVRVLAEDLQFEQHPEYAQGKDILAHAVLGCGYIPLGQETKATIMYAWNKYTKLLSLDQFASDVQRWKIAGANCIFVDTAGKDSPYNNTEARQMAAHAILQAAHMVVIWNAWNPQDLPWAKFTKDDHFLFELVQQELPNGPKLAYWAANHPTGSKSYGVTTKPTSVEQRNQLEALFTKYGVAGVQYRNDDHFSKE